MRIPALALAAALAAATGRPLAADAAPPDIRLRLVGPEDGEHVQGRPAFRIGLRGDGLTLAAAEFRIVIEKEGAPPVVVEQRATAKLWALYLDKEDPGAGYRPDQPFADGAYTWHADVKNGSAWIESERSGFVVDTVPPAAVGGVRLRRDPVKGTILVEWDPVTVDKNGAKEAEVKYRLYRYEPRPFFYGTLLNEMAVTLEPRWEDKDPKAIHAPTLFYVVRAIDAAWNESDVPLPQSGI